MTIISKNNLCVTRTVVIDLVIMLYKPSCAYVLQPFENSMYAV